MHRKALAFIYIIAAMLIAAGCNTLPEEPPPNFAFTFSYGIGARNVLDTFNGTFTKDMVVDKPITIEFKLSKEQLEEVYKKMLEIDFFNYPEKFNPTTNSSITRYVTPHSSYHFTVRAGGWAKEVYWADKHLSEDPKAKELRDLIKLIRGMIESSDEYLNLPAARGGYA